MQDHTQKILERLEAGDRVLCDWLYGDCLDAEGFDAAAAAQMAIVMQDGEVAVENLVELMKYGTRMKSTNEFPAERTIQAY